MFGLIKEPDDRSVSENNSEVVNIHWASQRFQVPIMFRQKCG